MTNNYDICWDEVALSALRKIFSYLKKNVSASIAIKFRNDVFAAVEKLIENPEYFPFDRLLLENPPRYRSIPVGGYKVVYEFYQDTIFVLLIYHSKQNPATVRKNMP
jgi:plasmid stabilization system protein ParE